MDPAHIQLNKEINQIKTTTAWFKEFASTVYNKKYFTNDEHDAEGKGKGKGKKRRKLNMSDYTFSDGAP